MKRFFLYLIFLFICIHTNAIQVGGIFYKITSENTVAVTYQMYQQKTENYKGTIVIPEVIEYQGKKYTVTKVNNYAFYLCSQLTSLSLPETITEIGNNAFYHCYALSAINIPQNVTSIGAQAFEGCSSITSIVLPNTMKKIYHHAFYAAGLTYVKSEIVTPFDIDQTVFPTTNQEKILEIPNGTKSAYRKSEGWLNNFTEVIDNGSWDVTITASGNGSVKLDGIEIQAQSYVFSFVKNSTIDIILEPREGYRVKRMIINDINVTNEIVNNKYTIENLSTDSKVVVDFEAIPATTHTLSITASGNGSASYSGSTIRGTTQSFTVNEGTSATVSFTPDSDYRIASVKLNNTDVTLSVSNNQYTISSISANTTLSVTFEAIPVTTYTLSITASGNGSASYSGTTVRGKSQSFTVNEGTSATVSFTPDSGYRIASVKLNNADVTSSVTNNQYTISSISANTTLSVTFEAIPPTTYTLSITASGNGSASYSGTTIRGKSQSFTVNEGTSATVSFTPDSGYRIASVKLNNADVTSSVSNNQYTISSISANTTLAVTFEAIPATTYTLSITASGNGSASYSGTTVRGKSQSFTVNEGTSATVSFTPDSGYRIASVKLNNTDVTSSVSNNQYTISSISANTTLVVTFEAIPVTTYTLSITASGNGSASYSGTTVRGKSQSFTVNEGTSATVSFTPDSGYRIASVKLNNTDVTSSVSNNQYTISNISANTTLAVTFEAIPPTTYTLSITASGNGSASYSGTTVRNNTRTFTLNAGVSATISLSPDSGHKIKSLKVNNTNVTASIRNNSYTINNIGENTTVEVEFEAITYSLSITSSGNGSANYGDNVVRNQTRTFTIEEGNNATITFSPDNGNRVSSVKMDNQNVTASVTSNRYTISNFKANVTLEVTFEEDINAITVDGLNYTVASQSDRTVILAGGDYGQVITIPSSVTANNKTWQVIGVDNNALKENAELAAIIWNPEVAFTATVSNPNLMLYVKNEQYAPSAIKNVVVNGTASSITLVDAGSGNSFFCPQAFTARSISYQHNYNMTTGKGTSQGWETIALPFDVQSYTHSSKGNIVPFANWRNGDASRPFWLYEMTGSGFVESGGIKAYTPYIISMPNNPGYDDEWILRGTVTFSASNVTIEKTEDLHSIQYSDRTFVPCFNDKQANEGLYALNVNNDYVTNNSGLTEGSKFVLNMRQVHPFEAYMTTASNARYAIGVFEGMTTRIQTIDQGICTISNDVYDLQGRKVMKPKKGLYIMNRKKVIFK